MEKLKVLRLLHFNDVYEISERANPTDDIPAGIARFVKALELARQRAKQQGIECLTAFSGDLLSPSRLSTSEQG
jgi:hypothetical protein